MVDTYWWRELTKKEGEVRAEEETGLGLLSSATLSSIVRLCYDQARSKRSRFITLLHAATKSFRNFS
jgi:hypothetical protein